jgi:hypothetical protein
MSRPLLVYVAAGAGMGHLTRACAVASHLAPLEVDVRIVTHSVHAETLRRATGATAGLSSSGTRQVDIAGTITIDVLPAAAWVRSVVDHVRRLRPALVALDTFPWGPRGEWRGVDDLRFVSIARRLNLSAYLAATAGPWFADSPTLRHTIICEPLATHHDALVRESGEATTLPGRIRFPAEAIGAPPPEDLTCMLHEQRTWLVVHSGPEAEVQRLIALAENDMRRVGGGRLAVIAPRPLQGRNSFEYFPAARLYRAAFRVVTGGGYNSVAELTAFPEKRLWVALPRRYDDQQGRLESAASLTSAVDGALVAAARLRAIIMS